MKHLYGLAEASRSLRLIISRRISLKRSSVHTSATCCKAFREGDIVLLKQVDRPDSAPILTKPLKQHALIQSHRGKYEHNSIIGKSVRDSIASTAGRLARLHEPTLEEYVALTPRLVTPIYSKEANLIVSLLDLHATPPPLANDGEAVKAYEPLEILEAGTGHGALTLHLARAIHAANAHLRQTPSSQTSPDSTSQPKPLTPDEIPPRDPPPSAGDDSVMLEDTRIVLAEDPRGAIVHTLDVSVANSRQARKTVQGFRHGIYAPSVDFHTSTIPKFLSTQASLRDKSSPYLCHAILDLPAPHHYLGAIATALKTDGSLLVFCPSVTQIVECVRTSKRERVGLFLERVVEVGLGMSAGKDWDVRLVRTRASLKDKAKGNADDDRAADDNALDPTNGQEDQGVTPSNEDATSALDERDETSGTDHVDGWEVVCRPKLGDRVTAGGFIGVWKKRNN